MSHRRGLAGAIPLAVAVNAMAYKSNRVGITQMFGELVAAGRTRHEAAVELGAALQDGAIELRFAGELVIGEIVRIAEFLRDLAADPYAVPIGSGSVRWPVVFRGAEADRLKFEIACGFSDPEPEQKLPGIEESSSRAQRRKAVREALDNSMKPPATISWPAFCDLIRNNADGWVDRKAGTFKRGFDERTIKRDVLALRSPK